MISAPLPNTTTGFGCCPAAALPRVGLPSPAQVAATRMPQPITPDQQLLWKLSPPCPVADGDRACARQSAMELHLAVLGKARPWTCPLAGCDKSFVLKKSLKLHLDSHNGERPFVCPVAGCGKAFLQKIHLKNHGAIHSRDKAWHCLFEGCSMRFSRLLNRTIHMRVHTGEKPYACPVEGCLWRFSQLTNRQRHLRTHNPERISDKPWACTFAGCGKRFTRKQNRRFHMLSHDKEPETPGSPSPPAGIQPGPAAPGVRAGARPGLAMQGPTWQWPPPAPEWEPDVFLAAQQTEPRFLYPCPPMAPDAIALPVPVGAAGPLWPVPDLLENGRTQGYGPQEWLEPQGCYGSPVLHEPWPPSPDRLDAPLADRPMAWPPPPVCTSGPCPLPCRRMPPWLAGHQARIRQPAAMAAPQAWPGEQAPRHQ